MRRLLADGEASEAVSDIFNCCVCFGFYTHSGSTNDVRLYRHDCLLLQFVTRHRPPPPLSCD
jgi:hypothetical protein